MKDGPLWIRLYAVLLSFGYWMLGCLMLLVSLQGNTVSVPSFVFWWLFGLFITTSMMCAVINGLAQREEKQLTPRE